MKTLYLTDSMSNIAVDPEENKVSCLPSEDRYDIRNVYYIDEPMHVSNGLLILRTVALLSRRRKKSGLHATRSAIVQSVAITVIAVVVVI